MITFRKFISLLLALLMLVSVFSSCTPADTDGESTDSKETAEDTEVLIVPKEEGLVLSELMASNSNVLLDDYGTASDWIELYNGSDKDINLAGYMISDSQTNPTKFIFPDMVIASGQYLVIWASGRNTFNRETGDLHLSFKINQTSEIVSLYSPEGAEIGRITVNELPTDISAGPDKNGRTMMFSEPTPGARNVETVFIPPETEPEVPLNSFGKDVNTVRINEYCTDDCVTLSDSEGDFGAWVEIFNYGAKSVNLTGLFLSDDEANPDKWQFPDGVVLEPGQYLVVFLMGKDGPAEGSEELHAGFTLTGKESKLLIFNGAGDIMDECPVYELFSNLTYGRSDADSEKWLFFPKATPGKANTIKGFEDINSARYPSEKSVYISEVVAVVATLTESPDGRYPSTGELTDYYDTNDYLELHNPGSSDINLSDYYIGKNVFANAVRLPDITLEAGEYKIIYFGDDEYVSGNDIYLDMGLNRYKNDLYIFSSDGICIDSVVTGTLFDGTSAGRKSTEDDGIYYFTTVTPGKANAAEAYQSSVVAPTFSLPGGYVEAGTELKISFPKGMLVYYTLDGSEPTTSGTLYTSPITVTESVTVRARAFKSGHLYSEDVSVSLIVGRDHKMPVIFLSTDPDNLFSEKTGIFAEGPDFNSKSDVYVGTDSDYSKRENLFYSNAAKYSNFWQDWERPVRFDYIDEEGNQVLSFNAGIQVFGQYSRVRDQKSVSIRLRDKYGIKEVVYPFFGDDYLNVFSSFVLRASGQDSNRAHIRDAFIARALEGEINCEVMNYVPVVVYINGEYFGIYDLREHISEDFVAGHQGADPENVDLIKGTSIVLGGSIDDYDKLYDFCTENNMRDAENYAYVCSMIDIDNYIDYWISQIYFANTDPGNIKFYHEKREGAKWRWIPYDFDWSLSSEENRFDIVFGTSKKVYAIVQALIKNEDFKEKFLTRFCTLLNTTLDPDRLIPLLRSLTDEISVEMEYHIARWVYRWDDPNELLYLMCSSPYTMSSWERNIQRIEDWLVDRDEVIIKHMKSYFRLSDSDIAAYGYEG